MEIKRYNLGAKSDINFYENENGNIVLYSDVAALLARIAELESNRCEHCGAKISHYSHGCPLCGAPQCCQQCCKIEHLKAENAKLQDSILQFMNGETEIQRENEELKKRLAAATEILEHVRLQFPLKDYGLDVLEDVEEFLTACEPKC